MVQTYENVPDEGTRIGAASSLPNHHVTKRARSRSWRDNSSKDSRTGHPP